MQLLYFDFDHGVERLLFIDVDREASSVHFRFEQSPDPTYEDEAPEVSVVSLRASTKCSSLEELFGFCRVVVAAMRRTPFSLQDPEKSPFKAISQDAFVLPGIGEGLRPAQLRCKMPAKIAAEIWSSGNVPEPLRALVE